MFKMLKFFALLYYVWILNVIADDPEEAEIHHLPNHVVPVSYDVKIIPDLESLTFKGKVTISLSVQYTTNEIKLHSKNLKIEGPQIYESDHRTTKGETKFDEKNDIFTITLYQSLSSGSSYVLSLDYEGKINTNLDALFASSYKLNDGTNKWLAATNFYGAHAREVFPCFDEPRFKASFTISIARLANRKQISNMALEGTYNSDYEGKPLLWDKFRKSPSMPTYLIAFVLFPSDYSHISKPNHIINIWTQENLHSYAQYAFTQSNIIFRQLEEFIGIPLKLSKLDIVAIPEVKAEKMGHLGIILFRERYLLIPDEMKLAVQHKTEILTSLSNELSRQWFGGLVTPVTWDFMWLTDGFAAYMDIFITSLIEPKWHIDQFLHFKNQQFILWEEISDQRALTTHINTLSKINAKNNIINIHKGSSIIRMLEHIISKERLRSAILKYLTDGQDKHSTSVTPNDLFEALESETKCQCISLPHQVSITDIMKTWTENIGYPLINVIRNPSTKEITIEQTAYKSPRATIPPPDEEWIIPITYTVKSEAQFSNTKPSLWSFARKSLQIPKPLQETDWIVCNLQRTGYYRVNYDIHNWNLLIEQLEQNPQNIHVLNRAQLIDDSFALAFDEKLSYDIPLRLGEYLVQETEPLPLLSAIFHLNKLYSKYENTRNRVFFCIYIVRAFEKHYQSIGFDVKPTDSYALKMARPTIISLLCRLKWKACIKNALIEYEKNIQDVSNVQPDLKEVVFCTALRHASNPQIVYDNLWLAYRNSIIAYDKITILKALGCTIDETLINKLLSKVIDPLDEDILRSDRWDIVKSILSSPDGVTAALRFIQAQISSISESSDLVRSSLKGILDQIEPNVQSETHIRLLHTLQKQFSKLDQKKFAHFTASFQRMRTAGVKRLRENNKNTENLTSIFYDILKITPPQSPPPRKSSSTGVTIVPTFTLYTCVVIYFVTIYKNILLYD